MRWIHLAALCLMAIAAGQRGSKRFTPSPFLQGQDIGFLVGLRTTVRPLQKSRAGLLARLPSVEGNEVDDSSSALRGASAPRETSRLRASSSAARRLNVRPPFRFANKGRRIQAVKVSVSSADIDPVVGTSATPAKAAAANSVSTATISPVTEPIRSSQLASVRSRASTRRRQGHRRRKVKKIRKIIHPEGQEKNSVGEFDDAGVSTEVMKQQESTFGGEVNLVQTASPAPSLTSTPSTLILRRKKIFRGSWRNRQRGGNVQGNLRHLSGTRRRVVTTSAPAKVPPEVNTQTESSLDTSTGARLEPFSTGGNNLVDPLTSVTPFTGTTEDSLFPFTKLPVPTPAVATTQLLDTQDSSTNNTSIHTDISVNFIAARGQIAATASPAAPPILSGFSGSESRGAVRFPSSGQQSSTRLRSRGPGSPRRGTSFSSTSMSRRKSPRTRRPSTVTSNAVTAPASTTEALTTTAVGASGTTSITTSPTKPTVAPFKTGGRFSFRTGVTGSVMSKPVSAFTAFLPSSPAVNTESQEINAQTSSRTALFTSSPGTVGFFQSTSPRGDLPSNSDAVEGFGTTTSRTSLFDFDAYEEVTNPAFGTFSLGTNFDNNNVVTERPTFNVLPTIRLTTPSPPRSGFASFSSSSPQSPAFTTSATGENSLGFRSSSGRSFSSSQAGSNSLSSSSSPRDPGSIRPVSTNIFPGRTNSLSSGASAPFSSASTSSSQGAAESGFSSGGQLDGTVHTAASGFGASTSSNGGFRPLTSPPILVSSTTPRPTFPTRFSFPSVFGDGAGGTLAPTVLTQAARFFGSGPNSPAPGGAAGTSVDLTGSHARPSDQQSGFLHFGSADGGIRPGNNVVTSGQVRSQTRKPSFRPVTSSSTAPQRIASPTSRRRVIQPPAVQAQTLRSPTGRVTQSPSILTRTRASSGRVTQSTAAPPTQRVGTFISTQQLNPIPLNTFGAGSQRANAGRALGGFQTGGTSVTSLIQDTFQRTKTSLKDSREEQKVSRPAFQHGFIFSQKNGLMSLGSHLAGFQSRVPTFREDIVINDPVFSKEDIKPGFTCEDKPYGYYADVANDCRIFHICQPVDVTGLNVVYTRYSFFCGKETRFDQSKLSCLHNQDAIPCDSSSDWLFRNDAFGTAEDQEDQQRELAAS